MSVSQNNHQHRPLMVQAPVRALDPDGVAVVTAGTIGFAVSAALCWWLAPQLAAAGKLWYLGVAIIGTLIGLIGLTITFIRRARRRRRDRDAELPGQESAAGAPARRVMEPDHAAAEASADPGHDED